MVKKKCLQIYFAIVFLSGLTNRFFNRRVVNTCIHKLVNVAVTVTRCALLADFLCHASAPTENIEAIVYKTVSAVTYFYENNGTENQLGHIKISAYIMLIAVEYFNSIAQNLLSFFILPPRDNFS